ncbi:hypothetical protein FB451DRAFT_1184359 [Mycena latifolia]|nr:hypothetical protein FB451DRAFT_1184359 [Mycena latifolia]
MANPASPAAAKKKKENPQLMKKIQENKVRPKVQPKVKQSKMEFVAKKAAPDPIGVFPPTAASQFHLAILANAVFMIPEAISTGDQQVPIGTSSSFEDAVELIYGTISCVSVSCNPTLAYNFSSVKVKDCLKIDRNVPDADIIYPPSHWDTLHNKDKEIESPGIPTQSVQCMDGWQELPSSSVELDQIQVLFRSYRCRMSCSDSCDWTRDPQLNLPHAQLAKQWECFTAQDYATMFGAIIINTGSRLRNTVAGRNDSASFIELITASEDQGTSHRGSNHTGRREKIGCIRRRETPRAVEEAVEL